MAASLKRVDSLSRFQLICSFPYLSLKPARIKGPLSREQTNRVFVLVRPMEKPNIFDPLSQSLRGSQHDKSWEWRAVQNCVKHSCKVLRITLKMFRCPPLTCTMAQYFSQPFPKPVWNVFIHYSVVNKICIKLEQNWAFEYILETVAVMKSPFPMFIFVQEWITLRLPSGNWLFGAVFLLPSGIDVARERADILALKHVSRIFERFCNNPGARFCKAQMVYERVDSARL